MQASRRRNLARVALAVLFVGILAYRSSLGLSSADDSHYAAITLRLAQGGRPLADEMTLQVFGFLLGVPFAKAWLALVGVDGFVLALRLHYVAIGSIASFAMWRTLRPVFGGTAALAVMALLVAPPYNLLALSYNTIAIFGYALAVVLGVRALERRTTAAAALAGVCAAVAAVSYPPLAVGGAVLVVTFLGLAKDRRLGFAIVSGAAGVGVVSAAWLLAQVSIDEIDTALAYSRAVWADVLPVTARLRIFARDLSKSLFRLSLVPMWSLAIFAALPVARRRMRVLALAGLPLAAALPALWYLVAHDGDRLFGVLGAATLVIVTFGAVVPIVCLAWRARDAVLMRAIMLAAPASIVNFVIVAVSTSSGWQRAVSFTGLAPLAVVLLVGWAWIIADELGVVAGRLASVGLVVILTVMLFGTVFKDGRPSELTARFSDGVLCGIATTPERAAEVGEMQAQGDRWVGDGDSVLVIGAALGYLTSGGTIHTNAVWAPAGGAGRFTERYLESHGALPDVVFVSTRRLLTASEAAFEDDPLLAWVAANYRLAEEGDIQTVFVRD